MANTTSASTSGSDQFPIYTGVWTNWSRGYILGATLTLRRRDADLLIAFTAFFVSFVASRVWRVICFILHRSYSTTNPQDVVYQLVPWSHQFPLLAGFEPRCSCMFPKLGLNSNIYMVITNLSV